LFTFGDGYFANLVYGKPDWDYRKANLDEATAASDQKFAGVLNAVGSDLKAFKARGGKLILYHGWGDAAISPLASIDYYQRIVRTMGRQESDSLVRLFMVPGMQHCAGGPGPDVFGQAGISPVNDAQHNVYLALEEWVEKGKAPSRLIASKMGNPGPAPKVEMTRPLCAYPQVAKYTGSGDTNDAENFVCGGE
jgi:hypothetical protein